MLHTRVKFVWQFGMGKNHRYLNFKPRHSLASGNAPYNSLQVKKNALSKLFDKAFKGYEQYGGVFYGSTLVMK